MTIRLHDTLTAAEQPLEPLEPDYVRIYSCGPTVYGPVHIGNFRSFLFADILVRHLRRDLGPEGERCAFALPQAVRSGLERGEIGWRDLIDFYARHRCETYHFPYDYRAFKKDNERSVPAVTPGM